MWDRETKVDDLRDTDGFATLDAKVLSAVTNVLEGEFARQIDSFKEREAHAGRLVRGRQVLAKLDAYFASSALHGSLYEFEDLLGVKLINEKSPRKISSWSLSSIDRSKSASQSLTTLLSTRESYRRCEGEIVLFRVPTG